MKLFLAIVLWALLLVLCWPIALAVLILFPLVWLLVLPFRILLGILRLAFALVRFVLFLPARILGFTPAR